MELALGNGTKKVMNSEVNNVKKLKKYFVANQNIKKGEHFTSKNIVAKRTGGQGIKADNYFDLIKKKANKEYYLNDIIKIKI